MKKKIHVFPSILLFVVLIFGCISISDSMNKPIEPKITKVEEFISIPNLTELFPENSRTQSFVRFLIPIIECEHSEITSNRKFLENLIDKNKLTHSDSTWLLKTAKYYKIRNFQYSQNEINELHNRIDIIPTEIVLSQAAIESNWGKSGFAKNNNNLFGMRTTSKTNGVIPKKRAANQTFLVASYKTVNQSIRSYMRNLNTHSAYKSFRQNRAKMRQENLQLDPYNLADGLTAYSTLGYDYVLMVKRTMKAYQTEFTTQFE